MTSFIEMKKLLEERALDESFSKVYLKENFETQYNRFLDVLDAFKNLFDNKEEREVALFSALSQKIRDDEVIFIDEIKVAEAKTKEMAAFLKAFNLEKSVLLVMDNADEMVLRASANLAKVSTIAAAQINTYDVVKNAKIVISKKAVEQIQEVYGE